MSERKRNREMVRTPCCDRSGLKKGTWTPEEDKKLKDYVTRYGCWNWRQLPKYAGLSRCGKSCRLRWMNYLRPDIKRGTFTEQEEDIIIKLHQSLGNKWSAIAAKLPGRTDNDIKNHWHTYLKKRMKKQNSVSREFQSESGCEKTTEASNSAISTSQLRESLLSSPQPSSSVSSVAADAVGAINWTNFAEEIDPLTDISTDFSESFWSQPFLADNFNTPSDLQAPLLVDQELLSPFSPVFGEEFLCSYGFYDEHSNVFSF